MDLNINPFEQGNPMTFKDAAIVATIAAFVIWVLNFLANATAGQIRADPAAFCFEAVKTYLIAWAGNFMTLSGLAQLIKRAEEKPSE